MARLHKREWRIIALFLLAYAASFTGFDAEAMAFCLTAPSRLAVVASRGFVRLHYAPTRAEQKFIRLAKLP